MSRRRGLRLFTVVAGLTLAWTLTVILPRARPPAKIDGPSGPSAVEEGWQSRPTPVAAPPAIRPKADPRAIARHRTRAPAKRTADAPRVRETRKPQDITRPPRTSAPPSPETRNLDEATRPPLEGSGTADVPPPAGPPAEASGSGLAPTLPSALTPPVLLTEPTQESGDQQVILERGQLTSQLRLEAREGRVVLRILVRADGSVAQAEVARSSGQHALDQAALTAVSSWRFDPATRDGAPIDAWVVIPVRFVVR